MEAIFIGTLDGIYKIVPAGGGWKIAGQDLAGAEVNCLAISPGRRNVGYAGLRGRQRDDNRAESRHLHSVDCSVGFRFPLNASSSGKVFLAHYGAGRAPETLPGGMLPTIHW